MGYRSFKDSTGAEWDAWDVVPHLGERRMEDRRQTREEIAFRDRRRAERRLVMSRRAVMAGSLSNGWLCFEGATQKRRLSPIPDDWTRCSESQLEAYCQMARPVRRPTKIDCHLDAPK
ncbi:MAG: hypothetical protein M3282_11730 [Gemmatimonadota bacterium]|nr:hypothetical protein [Gemmatimonadota bacterium]